MLESYGTGVLQGFGMGVFGVFEGFGMGVLEGGGGVRGFWN